MLAKLAILALVCAAMLKFDSACWKRADRRARIVYGTLMAPVVYLGFLYVANLYSPNLDELIDLVFLEPAKRLVGLIQIPSSS